MRLIIAEKPSLGRSIAAALGIRGSGRELIRGKNEIVTWCIGHLGELAMPDAYNPALKRWTWGSLPILPDPFQIQVASGDTRKQFYAIKKLANDPKVTEIVNACDAGREGEYIFDLVYRLSRCKKPVLRLWPKSLTNDALRDAYQSMKPGSAYTGLRDAARSRSEADWLVGLNGTRAQTLYARMKGMNIKGAASIGRVQTPVLNMLYLRWKEISEFVPQDFWTVLADFESPEGNYTGKWFYMKDRKEHDRLDKPEQAQRLIAMLKGKPAKVAKVDQKDVTKQAEQLYDLTTLQREANKRFGFTAEKTLQIAQQLYEDLKILSYPRTNSRHLCSDDLALLPSILGAIHSQSDYQEFVDTVRSEGWDKNKLGKRYVDDSRVEDHSALTPTKQAPNQPLSSDQKLIYDLVVRRVLAMYFPDRIEAKTTIITIVGDEKPQSFKSTGTVCKEEGWSVVDPTRSQTSKAKSKSKKGGDDEESSDDASQLPNVKQGQSVDVRKIYDKKGQTTPPKHYTEDTLLGAMETAGKQIDDDELKAAMKDCGLGTPVTRSSTIEKLITYGFIQREKKNLIITEPGIQQIESIAVDTVKNPEMTGDWEAKLAKMQRGQYDRTAFMREVVEFTQQLVGSIKEGAGGPEQLAQADQSGKADPLPTPCPKCGKRLFLRSKDGRDYVVCEGWKPSRKGQKAKGCAVVYTSDKPGAPEGGTCKFDGCDGPVQVTRKGSKICTVCEKWQDSPGTDSGVKCNRCKEHNYIVITFEKKGKKQSFLKCEHCEMTRDVDAQVQEGGCEMGDCSGDLIRRDGNYGAYWHCVTKDCGFTKNEGEPKGKGGGSNSGGRWGWELLNEKCPECKKAKLKFGTPPADSGKNPFIACQGRNCKYTRSPEVATASRPGGSGQHH